jgi:hypothetical protein
VWAVRFRSIERLKSKDILVVISGLSPFFPMVHLD